MGAMLVPELELPDNTSTLRGSRSWAGATEARNNLLGTDLSHAENAQERGTDRSETCEKPTIEVTKQLPAKRDVVVPARTGSDIRISRLSQQSSDRELARAILVSGDSSQDNTQLLPIHLRGARSWTYNEKASTWKFVHQSSHMTAFAQSPTFRSDRRFNSNVCAVCSTLDLRGLKTINHSKLTNEGFELCSFVGLHRSMSHSLCTLCRAFSSLLLTGFTRAQTAYTLEDGKIHALPASHLSGIGENAAHNPVVLGISLERNPIRWDAVARCTTELQGLILPLAGPHMEETGACHGLALQTYVKFSRLRSMLSRCAKDHRICQTPTPTFPINAKVIDCQARKVVQLKEGDRYLALSYVWGVQSSGNILNSDSDAFTANLPESLPRTIEDAIFVTIRLGLRFLWCDRYCIEQYHSADKRHQINQMASIYNRAVATICALGADDDAGLPGVSQKRCAFPVFDPQGTMTFSMCPAPTLLTNHISMSRWFTRGCTFQEALLSRRCIFFTPEQSHLVCCASSQHEGILQATRCDLNSNQLTWGTTATIFSTILDAELRWFHGIHGQLKFFDYMQHYLQRKFTVDEDALPAFQGILSIIENQSYFGVVVFDTLFPQLKPGVSMAYRKKSGFAHGLLWEIDRHGQSSKRRPSVPTWSWLSRIHTWPRLSSLSPKLSSERNSLGLACVTDSLDLACYVADISVLFESGEVLEIDRYLDQNKNHKVVQALTPSLLVTSVRSDITWTRLDDTRSNRKKGYKFECTFSLAESLSYKLSENNARFDPYKEPSSGVAVLLLTERYIDTPHMCIYRWLILQEKIEESLTCTGVVYERVGLFTFREDLNDTRRPMHDMVENNKNRKRSTWIE